MGMEKMPSGKHEKVEWKPGVSVEERTQASKELNEQWAKEGQWTELAGKALLAEKGAKTEEERAQIQGVREEIETHMREESAKREEMAKRLESLMKLN